jgi:hypothetical protein
MGEMSSFKYPHTVSEAALPKKYFDPYKEQL